MERLTMEGKFCDIANCSAFNCNGSSVKEEECDSKRVYDRLAAYEDTGLEPKDYSKMFMQLLKYKDLGDLDHLRELVEAEKDGRLVIAKAGYGNKDGETALKKAMYECSVRNNPVTRYVADAIVEKLNREAAEAALRGEEG